jgi:hypothetical protein
MKDHLLFLNHSLGEISILFPISSTGILARFLYSRRSIAVSHAPKPPAHPSTKSCVLSPSLAPICILITQSETETGKSANSPVPDSVPPHSPHLPKSCYANHHPAPEIWRFSFRLAIGCFMAMSSAKLSSTERVGRDTETEWVVKVPLKGFKDIGNRQ